MVQRKRGSSPVGANAGVSSTYDALGRPSSVSQTTELGNAVTQYAYLTGFKTRVTNPRTYRTETTFQAFGEPATNAPLSITAAVGSPEQQLTTITRNAFGNTTLLERSGTYAGQAVSSTRTYIYDANQRLCKRIEPESGVTLIDYNAAGNVAWTADGTSWTKIACDRHMVAASEKTLRSYDARNRPTLVNFPDTSADIATTYYPDGAVSSILTTDGSMLTYEYNRRRLLTSERLQHGSINWLVSHGYTALGDRATVTYPDGHIVSFAPNALGQPTQAGTYAAGVTYHPNGAIKGFTYGNGQVHSLSLNARQLPMTSRDAKGAEVAIDDTYDYDFNGNVAGISDALLGSPAGDRDMVYDALDRLAQVTAGPAFGGNGAWAYDPLDNIRLFTRDGITRQFNYDTNWQLSSIQNVGDKIHQTFLYDSRGNMTKRNFGVTHTFDRGNRMLTSSQGNSSYRYDGLGRRVRQTAYGLTTYYQYSRDGQLLYAQDGDQNSFHTYIYLSGSLVAKRTIPVGGGTASLRYQHTDGLGSLVAASNEAGTVVRRERFEAYGEPVDGIWDKGHGYTGHQMDPASELVYMQQRYYDPTLGRFLGADPVAADIESGDNFNAYHYARNNPFRNLDPDGRYTCDSTNAADCAELKRIVEALKKAAKKQRFRNRSAMRDLLTKGERDRLSEIVDYIGDENDGSGPTISFADLPDVSLANSDQNGSWTVDIKKILGRKDSELDGAMALAHEGQHDVDRNNLGMATTEDVVRGREDRAYRIQSALARARGATELSESQIKIAVDESVAKWKQRQRKEKEK